MEDVSPEASQNHSSGGLSRSGLSPFSWRGVSHWVARRAWSLGNTLVDFVYRTYEGAGIIVWLIVIALSPLPFLWAFLSLPFPLNTCFMLAVVLGYAFTRGAYISEKATID